MVDHRSRDAQSEAVTVNELLPASLLDTLVSRIRGVLGDDLVAVYLYGSAVSGGFDAGVSDVDLVAVTSSEIEAIDLRGLERMHDEVVRQHPEWTDRIEVVYVERATLESFRTSAGALAVVSPGEPFHVRDDRAAVWLQNWYLVRETGVCLFGPEATTIIPPIAWPEFTAAVRRYAQEIRQGDRSGASGGAVAYTVLTLCRALRVLRTQTLASKQEAAAWVRQLTPDRAWLIDAALDARLSGGKTGFDTGRTRAEAETFISLIGDEIADEPIV